MPRTRIHLDFEGDYMDDLRQRMEAAGVAPSELAREAGLFQSQLSRWFHGNGKPMFESVVRLETALRTLTKVKERAAKAEQQVRKAID